MSRTDAVSLDRQDPLAKYRELFQLEEHDIYLAGHSLGVMQKKVVEKMMLMLVEQWGGQGVLSWNTSGWIQLPERLGALIAPLIGAVSDEVIVADSTTINLYKLLLAAVQRQAGRNVILTDTDNFPADLYVAEAIAELIPDVRIILCDRSDIVSKLNQQTAVLMLTHTDYRTGEVYAMKGLTELAHAHGALTLFDLSHSAGVQSIDLNECGVDLAVGCTYKYLNGGPGSPAFLYVAKRHHGYLYSPVNGWMGHVSPFKFLNRYAPAEGVARFLGGTPPVLSMCALEYSLQVFADISIRDVRKKSLALGEFMIEQMTNKCSGMQLISPAKADDRGGHLAFLHDDAAEVVEYLQANKIVCDFRVPNVIRFGLSPLYVRYVDIFDVVEVLSRRGVVQ